ncbi:MAG: hypothetical protein ACE5KD_00530 [Candidatus Bathyarchaeia archaeon]
MIFNRKKFDKKKAYEELGLFCTVETSEASHLFGVPILRIKTYYKGRVIDDEPFSEELFDEKREKGVPIRIVEMAPKDFEKIPYNKIILGRLELPRAGLVEEEL